MATEGDIEFQRVVMEGLVPMVESSSICVSLAPQDENRLDAKFCVELGVMISLDKPILTLVTPGATISKKLRMVSDLIVEADLATEEGQRKVSEAIKKMQDDFS